MSSHRNYHLLAGFLQSCQANEAHLSFADIEQILGQPLPHGAYTGTWWANTTSAPHARGWLPVGWVVQPHARARFVTFTRQSSTHHPVPNVR